jgi:hypothetical protein
MSQGETMSSTVKRFGIGFGIACALGGASLVVPSAAYAAQPHCGDVVKHDVKLTHNLKCAGSGGDGLEIGKDGVDINLNGHKIIGPASSYDGIDNGGGYDGVTVRNGTIKGFYNGVYNYYAARLHLSHLDIDLKGTNSSYGVYAYYGLNDRIDHVTVDNASYAFYLYDHDGLRLTRSKATGNSSGSTYGLYGGYLAGKVDHFRASGANDGVYVYGNTPGLTISNGTFNNAGYTGIYVSNSTPLSQNRYTLTDNTANSAGSYGFFASYDVRGSGNKAKGAGTQNYYNVPH